MRIILINYKALGVHNTDRQKGNTYGTETSGII
jgi:hypothetical protein